MRVTWRVHPLREHKMRAVAALALAGGFLGFIGWLAGPGWAVLGALLAFLSTPAFWLPTTYVLDEDGVEVRRLMYRMRRPWSHFARYETFDGGVFLSPFPKPSRLDPFRGLTLLGAHEHPEAMRLIRERVGRAQD